MESSPVVLIVASGVESGLKTEADFLQDILLFAGTDPVHAVQAIRDHHPNFVVLQRDFLATPRAAELIGQIRTDSDQTVSRVQIRVISDVNAYVQLVSRRRQGQPNGPIVAPGDPLHPEHDTPQGARRFRTHAGVKVQVNGAAARLTNLSHTGAQLVTPRQLRPHQQVSILITDDQQGLRLTATVVQASLEPSRDSDMPPHYQVGVAFIDADPETLEVFCARNQG